MKTIGEWYCFEECCGFGVGGQPIQKQYFFVCVFLQNNYFFCYFFVFFLYFGVLGAAGWAAMGHENDMRVVLFWRLKKQ
jgi:hypothetical protein